MVPLSLDKYKQDLTLNNFGTLHVLVYFCDHEKNFKKILYIIIIAQLKLVILKLCTSFKR